MSNDQDTMRNQLIQLKIAFGVRRVHQIFWQGFPDHSRAPPLDRLSSHKSHVKALLKQPSNLSGTQGRNLRQIAGHYRWQLLAPLNRSKCLREASSPGQIFFAIDTYML